MSYTPLFSPSEFQDPNSDPELHYSADYYSWALSLIQLIFNESAFDIFENKLNEEHFKDRMTLFDRLSNKNNIKSELKKEHHEIFEKCEPILDILIPILNTNITKRTQHTKLIHQLETLLLDYDHTKLAELFGQTKAKKPTI